MEFMTTKEAVEKWNISERRVRQLLQDGRIEGAVKVGNSWNIPIDADKPVDKRIIKPDDNKFIIITTCSMITNYICYYFNIIRYDYLANGARITVIDNSAICCWSKEC